MIEVAEEMLREAIEVDGPPHSFPASTDGGARAIDGLRRGFRRVEAGDHPGTALAARLHHEALVGLGQPQVVTGIDLGAGPRRRAEAELPGFGALHGDDEGSLAARAVARILGAGAAGAAVVDTQGGEIARPDADEGQRPLAVPVRR